MLNLDTVQVENITMEKSLVFSKNSNEVFFVQQNKNGIEFIQNKNANSQVVIHFYFLYLV